MRKQKAGLFFQLCSAARPTTNSQPRTFPSASLSNPNCRVDAAVSAQCPDGPSTLISDTNDVTSSQAVFSAELVRTIAVQAVDEVISTPDPNGFEIDGINVRHVEPRNTPTIINVIFNKLQFWDGRAKETFNGVNIQGDADPTAFVLRAPTGHTLTPVQISLDNSSLASLVTGPPLNISEVSAAGRIHPEIGTKFLRRAGKKLGKLRPL